MVYQTPQELKADYPDIRAEMDWETEYACVQDLFDTYDAIGFRNTFKNLSIYEQYDGMRFKVLRRLEDASYIDIELQPMWEIQFEDGERIDAWPAEICKDLWPDHTVNTDVPPEFDIRKDVRQSRGTYDTVYQNSDGGRLASLNEAGWELYSEWEMIYHAELNRLRAEQNDPDFHEGWCIIDNEHFVRNIEDEVGLRIFGYDNDAIWQVFDTGMKPDEIWRFSTTTNQFIELLLPYFNLKSRADNR